MIKLRYTIKIFFLYHLYIAAGNLYVTKILIEMKRLLYRTTIKPLSRLEEHPVL